MKYYYIIFLIVYFILSGCNSQAGRSSGEQSEFHAIDFEKSFEAEQQMLISEIADTVEYLELNTPEDIIITRIRNIIPFDDYLLIQARGFVFLFHKNGQFIRPIGTRGQGPEEYTVACDVRLDIINEIIVVLDIERILYYDFKGNFIRSRKLSAESFGISDSILWIGNITNVFSKYKAIAFSLNDEMDTVEYIQNHLYGITSISKGGANISAYTSMFYNKNNLLYFKGDESSDSIWEILGADIKPYAVINMGKYKLPLEFEPWYSIEAFEKNVDKYWFVPMIADDDNYIFLSSVQKRLFKNEKDLFKYIVYDKKKKKGFTVNDKNCMGITDDILGGPPLWPRWVSDEYYINAIEAYELLEKVDSGEYSPSVQLKGLLSRIGEDSNQLIVLCSKKKNN